LCAQAKTIDEVMKHHQDFLDSSLKGCMLTNLDLFKARSLSMSLPLSLSDMHPQIVSNLLSVCMIFADNSERFVNSLTVSADQLAPVPAAGARPAGPAATLRARQETIAVRDQRR
jgi:hypothetical protein